MSYQIRTLKPQEVELYKSWVIAENWNPGFNDVEISCSCLDPEGFFLGFLDNQPIAAIGVVQYDQNLSFVGYYVVKPQFRGKGYGKQIWNKAFERISSKTVGLEAVQSKMSLYQKIGYKVANRSLRYQLFGNSQKYTSQHLIDGREVNIQDICKYDRQCFPCQRTKFLQAWRSAKGHKSVTYIQDKEIKGYGVLRQSVRGYRIGPLYADNTQIAAQILKYLSSQLPNDKKIGLDMPDNNHNIQHLIQMFKMQPGSISFRMYKNELPQVITNIKAQKVFSLTSRAYG